MMVHFRLSLENKLLGIGPHWPETLISYNAASIQKLVCPGPILPRIIQTNMLALTNFEDIPETEILSLPQQKEAYPL